MRLRPKLVIIGAQKAGTTTLFDVLSQHPRIIPPRLKEISFFSNEERYAKGMGEYWSKFPSKSVLSGHRITFEASPMYLYNREAPVRIARHLPDALCLVVLRDPVDRAYSAWNMYHGFKDDARHGHLYDPRTFQQAVEDELAGKNELPGRRYLDRGLYMPQLTRYLNSIGGSRLIIERFERLVSDPQGLVNDVLERLGLEPMSADHPAFVKRSNTRTYAQPLDHALALRLQAFFREDQERLSRLPGVPDSL